MKSGRFTIFGAGGFIGSRLVDRLRAEGTVCVAVTRERLPRKGTHLGHAVYAIGLTSDFRSRPFATVDAHVSTLAKVLETYTFDSFLYLSSTRVYRGSRRTSEDVELKLSPGDPDRFYEATKLAGEALCLALPNPAVRVARLSNIFGPGDRSQNFLADVVSEARRSGEVVIRTSPQSAKDYLHIDDACLALAEIARGGAERIYNVASGVSVTHAELAGLLKRRLGAKVRFAPGGALVAFPRIDVRRLAAEILWHPRRLADAFEDVLSPAG